MSIRQPAWESMVKVLDNGCHEFTGPVAERRYGIYYFGGKNKTAHRFAFFLRHGRWPLPGFQLDHTCHNNSECEGGLGCPHRRCVNADHLEEVTPAENKRRGRAGLIHAQRMALKTHCAQGHEFTPENTRIKPAKEGRGWQRVCRICDRKWARVS